MGLAHLKAATGRLRCKQDRRAKPIREARVEIEKTPQKFRGKSEVGSERIADPPPIESTHQRAKNTVVEESFQLLARITWSDQIKIHVENRLDQPRDPLRSDGLEAGGDHTVASGAKALAERVYGDGNPGPHDYALAFRDAVNALRSDSRFTEPFSWAPYVFYGSGGENCREGGA